VLTWLLLPLGMDAQGAVYECASVDGLVLEALELIPLATSEDAEAKNGVVDAMAMGWPPHMVLVPIRLSVSVTCRHMLVK
jgi:hypothetical protein